MPEPIPTERFNHAAINATDMERSVAFYTGVLGFTETARPAFDFAGAWLYREGLGMMLHLTDDGPMASAATINSRTHHLAFRVSDFDAALRSLEEHGVKYEAKQLPTLGYWQVFFHDPDGNVIELGEWPDVEQLVQEFK